ncbi:NUDIX hydrolase [Amycolatopsis sp. NPDC004079]|uniref:NUDIX hydrolase n=1 Tax=Amycolatopsis sp. NPDC004079 TaxID=3154549 RepID=UPI0033AEF272
MISSIAAWRTGPDPDMPAGGCPSLKAHPVSTGSSWTLRDLSALADAIRDQPVAELSHGDLPMVAQPGWPSRTELRQVGRERGRDVGAWAIPGGMVDRGEYTPATLVRELREETGIDLAAIAPTVLGRERVVDWRNTDHARVASTFALFIIEEPRLATAGSDACWIRFEQLAADLEGGGLYASRQPLLQRALDRPAMTSEKCLPRPAPAAMLDVQR